MRGQRRSDCSIDEGLAIISYVTAKHSPRRCWTYEEQAYICGCSRERMRQIAERGLRKCRIRLTQILKKEFGQAELEHRLGFCAPIVRPGPMHQMPVSVSNGRVEPAGNGFGPFTAAAR
jgi:hypothetical protein